MTAGIEHSERGLFIRMSPQAQEKTCQSIAQGVRRLVDQGKTPIVLVSPQIRPGLRQITQVNLPRLKVLSYNEITRDTQIESHGLVTDAAPVAGGLGLGRPHGGAAVEPSVDAARESARLSAHREAVLQYERALRVSPRDRPFSVRSTRRPSRR